MHSEESQQCEPGFERELRGALGRVQPPTGFAASVMRRLPAPEHASEADSVISSHHGVEHATAMRTGLPWFQRSAQPQWKSPWQSPWQLNISPGIAAALVLMLLLPLGGYLRQRYQQGKAQAAAQQFTLAMRLTQAALHHAGEHVAGRGHAREAE